MLLNGARCGRRTLGWSTSLSCSHHGQAQSRSRSGVLAGQAVPPRIRIRTLDLKYDWPGTRILLCMIIRVIMIKIIIGDYLRVRMSRTRSCSRAADQPVRLIQSRSTLILSLVLALDLGSDRRRLWSLVVRGGAQISGFSAVRSRAQAREVRVSVSPSLFSLFIPLSNFASIVVINNVHGHVNVILAVPMVIFPHSFLARSLFRVPSFCFPAFYYLNISHSLDASIAFIPTDGFTAFTLLTFIILHFSLIPRSYSLYS